MDYDDVDH